jgi:hypothetical protein
MLDKVARKRWRQHVWRRLWAALLSMLTIMVLAAPLVLATFLGALPDATGGFQAVPSVQQLLLMALYASVVTVLATPAYKKNLN